VSHGPTCPACGARLRFFTDGGRLFERCGCPGERPVPLRGARRYDQRDALDAELAERVRVGSRAPDPAFARKVGRAP
jgi:hypothetical protein